VKVGRSWVSQPRPSGKSFEISKWAVREAYRRVEANKGAPGVDGVSIGEFEKDLKNDLYRVWNRMSSGTYFPPPVKAVEISKSGGGSERSVCPPWRRESRKRWWPGNWRKRVEPMFHPDSYGYRPRRSALDAVGICRRRCWTTDWVID
jgi:retron-type reverse transcriptase